MNFIVLIFHHQPRSIIANIDAALEKAVVAYRPGHINRAAACEYLVISWSIYRNDGIGIIRRIICSMRIITGATTLTAGDAEPAQQAI